MQKELFSYQRHLEAMSVGKIGTICVTPDGQVGALDVIDGMVVLSQPFSRDVPFFGQPTPEEIQEFAKEIDKKLVQKSDCIIGVTNRIAMFDTFQKQCASRVVAQGEIRVNDVIWSNNIVRLVLALDVDYDPFICAKTLAPNGFHGPTELDKSRRATLEERDSVKAKIDDELSHLHKSLAKHVAEREFWERVKRDNYSISQ